MSNSIYGNKTIAKDGFEYSSKFEAAFVDKFLIPHNISYERQKLYSEESKHRCDFYLPDYDVWVECVYEEYLPKKAYLFAAQDLILSIPYSDISGRTRAKSAGAKWNGTTKKWIIAKTLIPPEGFPSLERYMDDSLLDTWFDPVQVNLTETYNANLKKKMLMYGDKCTIIQVNNSDLNKKSAHIADLIRIKNNDLFLKLRDEKPHLIPIYEAKIETTVEEVPTPEIAAEPEPKEIEPNEVIIDPNGKVIYSSKRVDRQQKNTIKKTKLQERRRAEFKMLLNGSTKSELQNFLDMITERLAKLTALAEKRVKKGKEFPDK